MSAATITQTTLTGGYNQAALVAQIKTVMDAAGWILQQETAGTTHSLWYKRVYDAGKTYGTPYLLLRIPNAQNIAHTYGVTYRTGNTGDGQVGNGGFTAWSTDVTFYAINHAEVSGFIARSGAERHVCLFFRPPNKPSWWDENSYAYGFGLFGNAISQSFTVSGQPSTLGITCSMVRSVTGINATNPRNGAAYEVATRLTVTGDSTYIADFGTDVVSACYPTASIGITDDLIVTAGVEEYLVIASGIAVRRV